MELEKKFLHEIAVSIENLKKAFDLLVDETYFQYPDSKNLFKVIQYNFKTYGTVLQSDTLQSLLRMSKHMTPEAQSRVAILFEELKSFPVVSDFNVLLDELREYYKTNSIKQSLEKAVTSLHDKNPDEAMSRLKTDLVTLERSINVEGHDAGYFGSDADAKLEQYLDAKAHPELYRGIDLGFSTIDSITNGLPKGSVTIIMGTAKSAKSVLMVNVAYHNLLKGKRVYYHVNEGGRSLVEQRIACRATGLIMDKIERRTLDDTEFNRYSTFMKVCGQRQLLYVDSVPRSLSSASYIERKVEELSTDGPIDLIIIDYMSLMKPDDRSMKTGWERLSAISLELKDLGMKTNIPILTIMHVNRPGAKDDKKNFDLEDMGLSYEPSKNVDLVMSWRLADEDELKSTRQAQGNLSIEASRFSGTGDTTLKVNTNVMLMEEFDLSKMLH